MTVSPPAAISRSRCAAATARRPTADDNGYEGDYLPVEVATIADLEVSMISEGATSLSVVGYDSAFEIKAGTDAVLDVIGTSRGTDLTGDFEYAVFLDARVRPLSA